MFCAPVAPVFDAPVDPPVDAPPDAEPVADSDFAPSSPSLVSLSAASDADLSEFASWDFGSLAPHSLPSAQLFNEVSSAIISSERPFITAHESVTRFLWSAIISIIFINGPLSEPSASFNDFSNSSACLVKLAKRPSLRLISLETVVRKKAMIFLSALKSSKSCLALLCAIL